MQRKNYGRLYFSVGFTIFASFFGAGNLIFPPHLGLLSGRSWLWAFLAYILMDAGLGAVTLIAISRNRDGFEGIVKPFGSLGPVLIFLNALFLGPASCVPRTAAVTFELAIHPVAPSVPVWVVSLLYFILVIFLCLRPAKIIDIVGFCMTPVLLAGLILLIVKGFSAPAAPILEGLPAAEAFREGLKDGYQTMDMLMATLLPSVLIAGTADKQYSQKDTVHLLTISSLIAAAGLFVVYGGLAYLGAVSGQEISSSNAEILLGIAENLLGKNGLLLLSIIVTLACLTTAIGLISACARAFCSLTHERVSYQGMVFLIGGIGFVISNFGLDSILNIASPVLELIYPALVIAVALSFLPEGFAGSRVCISTVAAGLAVALWTLIDNNLACDLYSSVLPLSSLDLGWLLPAVLTFFAARCCKKRRLK